MPSGYLIFCHSLLLLPSIFPHIRVFSNELALHIRWPKYWSFNFIISLSKENSGLISFRIDFLYLLVVQGTHNYLLQNRSSKASVLQHSSLIYGPTFTLVHDYWENHRFDYMDFVGKVMSLLFNILSRLVITFLPKSKHLLISCLQSLSAVALEPKKIKSVTVSTFPNIFVLK